MADRKQQRHERLTRLLEAMRHLKRVQEMRVRAHEARMLQLQERRDMLLAAFDSTPMRAAGLLNLLRRNLDDAVRQAKRTQSAKELDAAVLRERHMQLKRIERLSHAAGRELRESRGRDALLDAVEQAVRRARGKQQR